MDNWNTNTVPVAGDNALLNGTATITADVTSSGSRLNVLEVGRWFGSGTVTQTAGTLYTAGFNVGFVGTGEYNLNGVGSIDMTGDFLLGHSGGGADAATGTFNMNTSGSFTTNIVRIADSSWGSNLTSGTFDQSAGTTTSTFGFAVGGNATSGGASYKGVMNLSGGIVNSNGNFRIGDGDLGAKGEFTMTGGTLNVTGANGTEFWVGNGHAADYSTVGTGTASISSGTLNVGSWLVVGRAGGTGTLTISGDAVVNQGTTDAGAMLEMGNFGADNNSILNLDGGTLVVNGIYDNGGAGNSTTFNFNGGTLKSNRDNGDFLNADIINVKDGGAVIDSNGFNITIDNALVANGSGGLTKNGAGTLTMTADHTFTGAVMVNAGTLSVTNGSDAANNAFSYSSGITVNSGATLRATNNALFGWDGSQAKTITINGGTAIAVDGDQNVGNVVLNGGTLASVNHDNFWGSWHFGRNGSFKTLSVTDDSTVSAQHVAFTNGADIDVAAGKTLDFSGSIGDGGFDGPSSVIAIGGGTLVLAGINEYTGATVINGGTLALGASGSIDNTSGVSLGTGGTFDVSAKAGYAVNNLIGSGNVIGALTVSTELAAGNSPGTIDFSSDLTLGAASTYTYELVGGGTAADLGNVAGNLTIDPGAILDLVQLGTYTVGDKFTLFSYSGALSGTFFGLGDDTIFTAAGGDWQINYDDTVAGLNGGSHANFVTVTAIPEPRAVLLGGLGLLALMRRRRN